MRNPLIDATKVIIRHRMIVIRCAAPDRSPIRPARGDFCHRHFSWLCQAGQGQCQSDNRPKPITCAGCGDDISGPVYPAGADGSPAGVYCAECEDKSRDAERAAGVTAPYPMEAPS